MRILDEINISRTNNQNLQIELEKKTNQLALERQLCHTLQQDLELNRISSSQEISKVIDTVRRRIENDRNKRKQDLSILVDRFSSTVNSSLQSSVNLSVDEQNGDVNIRSRSNSFGTIEEKVNISNDE